MGLKYKEKKRQEEEKKIVFPLANLNSHIFLTKGPRVVETILSYLQELAGISALTLFY